MVETTCGACTDLGILALKHSTRKVTRELASGENLCVACECTKDEYEKSFKRLNSLGLGKVSKMTSRNRKKVFSVWKIIASRN